MASGFILVGFGGQGRVVRAALQALERTVAGYIDSEVKPESGLRYFGKTLLEAGDAIDDAHSFAVCIGDNAIRQRFINELAKAKAKLPTIIHPQAFVDSSASIGAGTFVGPKAVVHAHARIGMGCIVNTGAIVEHDSEVADFAHIAPGAVLCGEVQVGAGTLVGANATVLPQVRIGAWATVGAGAVLKHSLDDSSTHR